MGQHGSKSSIEARVIFHRFDSVDMYRGQDACYAQTSVVHIQKKMISQSTGSHSSRLRSWSQSRCHSGALVYVMDNPTGGVWVKPGGKWTRS